MSVKIIVADDHKIVRDGLISMLDKEPDFRVVAEAEDGRQAVRLCEKHLPDVVVMDIVMPDLNGIEATQQIVSSCPNSKVIALSMHTDRRFVTRMLKSGASGYLLKDSAFNELASAIRTVVSGQIYLNPKVAGVVVDEYLHNRNQDEPSGLPSLTAREREVLQLLAEGRSTKEVASHIHVSVKTVETHRQNIMKKLNIFNLADLVKYAIREGITSLDT